MKSICVLSVYKCILMSVLISLSFIIILVLLFCALSVKAHWPIAGWGWIFCPRLLSTPSFTPSPVKAHTKHPHCLTPPLAACWVATSPLISAPLYQRQCKITPPPSSLAPEALAQDTKPSFPTWHPLLTSSTDYLIRTVLFWVDSWPQPTVICLEWPVVPCMEDTQWCPRERRAVRCCPDSIPSPTGLRAVRFTAGNPWVKPSRAAQSSTDRHPWINQSFCLTKAAQCWVDSHLLPNPTRVAPSCAGNPH